MNKSNLLMGVLGVALSLGLIYATIYVGGKAWKSSQNK
jgi:hypothetical protein